MLFMERTGVAFFISNVFFAISQNNTSENLFKCFRMYNHEHKIIKYLKILVQVLFTTSMVVHEI